jgi:galactose oxidase
MANLGNAWHLPGNPEPRGHAGMRDPVFPTEPVSGVIVITGNQFQGGGNPGNQLQDGSSVSFKPAADAAWQQVPLIFAGAAGNNKYYSGTIPVGAFQAGAIIQYYFRIAYDDHAETFLHAGADGMISITTGDEDAARSAPFMFTIDTLGKRGRWGTPFQLPNVGIHANVLPTGLVLMWGRRDSPDQSLDTDPAGPLEPDGPNAPAAQCTPFLWNPASGEVTPTPQPVLGDPGTANANLFCSGHAFLPDGRLLVAGGHLADSNGLNHATIYDPVGNQWTPTALMNYGRWYPTAVSMPDGSILVVSGSVHRGAAEGSPVVNNVVPQIWSDGGWTSITPIPGGAFDLYPRLHVASDGIVYMTSLIQTWSLDISGGGTWTAVPGVKRINGLRDYAPSVLYDVDKVIFIGGGSPPTANAETIDLGQAQPAWRETDPMRFPRRQHNATLLPDGTVLVTGGTRGSGNTGTPEAFNDLGPGRPVHIAELWDPATGHWTELAAEQTDRCYHSTAVLLPDATVLSAGGGEFFPFAGQTRQNDPQDSHRDAQVFSPPYLFKGTRPEITSAPASVHYGATFEIGTPQPDDIGKVSWIGLSSVTHAYNMSQSINFLPFQTGAGSVTATAPSTPNSCPPGHYMLFILNRQGVPSTAKIMRIAAPADSLAEPAAAAEGRPRQVLTVGAPAPGSEAPKDAVAQRAMLLGAAKGTRVVAGITGTCPYGIAACWGGANEALHNLEGVRHVDPIPDADSSTATVYLEDDRLPALDRWDEQFRRMVHATYLLRGVEVSLTGTVEAPDGAPMLAGEGRRPPVELAPLGPGEKIQWDRAAGRPEPAGPGEAAAYDTLTRSLAATGARRLTVTGPLEQAPDGYRLQVRLVEDISPERG